MKVRDYISQILAIIGRSEIRYLVVDKLTKLGQVLHRACTSGIEEACHAGDLVDEAVSLVTHGNIEEAMARLRQVEEAFGDWEIAEPYSDSPLCLYSPDVANMFRVKSLLNQLCVIAARNESSFVAYSRDGKVIMSSWPVKGEADPELREVTVRIVVPDDVPIARTDLFKKYINGIVREASLRVDHVDCRTVDDSVTCVFRSGSGVPSLVVSLVAALLSPASVKALDRAYLRSGSDIERSRFYTPIEKIIEELPQSEIIRLAEEGKHIIEKVMEELRRSI